jgi:copper chaperone CopZ
MGINMVEKIKETTLNVAGMHCKSCEMLIKDVLEEQKGVRSVHASFKEGTVKVSYNEQVISDSAIKTFIKNEGYKVA